jgi:hypothetical protein
MIASESAAGKRGPPDKKGSGTKSSGHTSEPLPSPDVLAVTINVKTGQVIEIEGVNGSGAHKKLSDEEKARLARETGKATLEAIIEEAFEAGIACVLGDEPHEYDPPDSEEDANLRHLLLRPLLEASAAKRLMRRDVLSRAFLKTLIHHAPGSRTGPRE